MVCGDNPTWFAQDGDAPAWFRILFYGPITNPTINVGAQQFYIETTIDADTILEVSSYPWARRIVDNTGVNHRTKLRGSTQYLDELRIFPKDVTPIRWVNATVGLATWSEIESTRWDPNPWFGGPVKMPWNTYTRVSGQRVFWSGDKVSGGYLSAHLGKGVIIDSVHSFQTANQFAQVSICEGDQKFFNDEIPDGKTTVCIFGNAAMTQYAGLQIEKNNSAIGIDLQRKRDYIRLISPTGPLATYDLGVGGLHGEDTVSIEATDANKTVKIKLNGATVLTYPDTTNKFVWTNRRQGFIVNDDSLPFRDGCRVNNLIAHDISITLPTQTGRCFFAWRDAYNVV